MASMSVAVSIVIKMVPELSRHNLDHKSVVNSTISCAGVLVRANSSLSALSCFLRPANLSGPASASQASLWSTTSFTTKTGPKLPPITPLKEKNHALGSRHRGRRQDPPLQTAFSSCLRKFLVATLLSMILPILDS